LIRHPQGEEAAHGEDNGRGSRQAGGSADHPPSGSKGHHSLRLRRPVRRHVADGGRIGGDVAAVGAYREVPLEGRAVVGVKEPIDVLRKPLSIRMIPVTAQRHAPVVYCH
jgi:hypothetical protein